MGPAGVNTCDFPAGECRFAKVQGSAGHRYAGHIMPPLTCQPAKHRAYQVGHKIPKHHKALSAKVTLLGVSKKESTKAHLWGKILGIILVLELFSTVKVARVNNRNGDMREGLLSFWRETSCNFVTVRT